MHGFLAIFGSLLFNLGRVSTGRIEVDSNWIPKPPTEEQTEILLQSKAATGFGKVNIGGWYSTCFLANITLAANTNITLQVMLDTGSTTLAVPKAGLSGYSGTGVSINISANAPTASGNYGDGSWWSGNGVQTRVTLTGTNVTASNAPVAIITSQSTDPTFVAGGGTDGLLGLGFTPLSSLSYTPGSVFDAWVASGTVSSDAFSIFGCSADKTTKSWIDFGNDSPSTDCNPSGAPVAWASIPTKTYYTLDIKAFYVGGVNVTLPSSFQVVSYTQIGGSTKAWSIWDSCTSLILVPDAVKTAMDNAIIASGALNFIPSNYRTSFLNTQITVRNFQFSNSFPNFTIEVASTTANQNILLTMGPRQYIQPDPNGYYAYMISGGNNDYANLGVPLHTSFFMTFDRSGGRVGIAPGCGCDTATDGYPTISTRNSNAVTTSSSTSTSTSTSQVTGTTTTMRTSTTVNSFSSTSTVSTTRIASSSSSSPTTTPASFSSTSPISSISTTPISSISTTPISSTSATPSAFSTQGGTTTPASSVAPTSSIPSRSPTPTSTTTRSNATGKIFVSRPSIVFFIACVIYLSL